MDNKIKRYGFVGIILQKSSDAVKVQQILSANSALIQGRMGLPHLENNKLSVITLIVSGSSDEVGSLTGKLGTLPGVRVKSGLCKLIE